MKGYKIGDRVKDDITDVEGIIIATDDRTDQYRKVKVKWDVFLKRQSWEFESMLQLIINI